MAPTVSAAADVGCEVIAQSGLLKTDQALTLTQASLQLSISLELGYITETKQIGYTDTSAKEHHSLSVSQSIIELSPVRLLVLGLIITRCILFPVQRTEPEFNTPSVQARTNMRLVRRSNGFRLRGGEGFGVEYRAGPVWFNATWGEVRDADALSALGDVLRLEVGE